MADTWTKINSRLTAMEGFYGQVDETRKRLKQELFYLIDPLTKQRLDDVTNVTENRSVTYATRIIAGLMSSKWQCVVEGRLTKRESHKIEEILGAAWAEGNEYVQDSTEGTDIQSWMCAHVCHTSLIGIEWISWIEDGELKIHCQPLDMRYTPYVSGKWAAPITWRDKDDLEAELERYEKMAKDGGGEFNKPELKELDNEVRDYWDEKDNELWVDSKLVFRQKNTYGKLPFVFVWKPSGFMFRDKGYLKYESPSILFLNNNLYDQLSRQLSVDATLGFNTILPAYEREVENPTAGQSLPVPKRGESQDVLRGERHLPVPTPDINRAQLTSGAEINRLIDEAAPMVPRAYTQPPSAIEVATEVEILDEIQNPGIITLQIVREKLDRLTIDQIIIMGEGERGAIEVGKIGRRVGFSVTDLKDPRQYAINYQLMKQNKRLAIVNESRALALWGKAPMRYILRDILAVEDPDGWLREMELEKAKAANPAISLVDMAVRYAEEAEELEGSQSLLVKWNKSICIGYISRMESPIDEMAGRSNQAGMVGIAGRLRQMFGRPEPEVSAKKGSEKDLKNWQSMMLVHDYVQLMRQRTGAMPGGEAENIREATRETGSAQALAAMGRGMATQKLPQITGAQKGG